MNDEPVPDILDGQDPGVTASGTAANPLLRPLARGVQAADGFRPSDQNDSPTPDIARAPIFGDEGFTTTTVGTAGVATVIDPGVPVADAVEPSDQSDDPTPDIVQDDDFVDTGITTASTERSAARATVSRSTIAYIEQNPLEPVAVGSGLTVGATLPADVELRPIPTDPAYAYVYLDEGPALVDPNTRTIVWVR